MSAVGTAPRDRRSVAAGLWVGLIVLAACGDDVTGPEFEVIEEIEFATSLGIDLATFERRNTGVYWKDLVVGTGEEVVFGSTPTISFTGYLKDGTEFQTGEVEFLMGNNAVIAGLEDGMLNQRVGGTRRLIIPPNRGYGGQGLVDLQTGELVVPAGSVIIFDVTVDSLIVP